MDEKKENVSSQPAGYFIFGWLQARNSVNWIIYLLIFSCAILFVADFIYHRHGHFSIEEWPGFFAIYGFVMFSAIIFGAKTLRFFPDANNLKLQDSGGFQGSGSCGEDILQ